MEKSINVQLGDLYRSKWKAFSNELNKIVNKEEYGIKPTNPLLLNHRDSAFYESADIRVMIIGQETYDWEGVFYDDIDKILTVYPNFYHGYKYTYRGYFNNHFNQFLWLLEQKYLDKKISCLWNNVIKVGKSNDKGTPPEYILEIEQKYFKVLMEEIKIVKPNVILFYSGHAYDKYILHHIPELIKEEIEGFNFDELQLFKIENVDFAFRIPHPTTLHFMSKVSYDMIYEKIISEISFN
ncbi:MAG: hypothetical protein WC780_07020 [Lentimicrobiaceae bacterium]|jgi:hypothetical protein